MNTTPYEPLEEMIWAVMWRSGTIEVKGFLGRNFWLFRFFHLKGKFEFYEKGFSYVNKA